MAQPSNHPLELDAGPEPGLDVKPTTSLQMCKPFKNKLTTCVAASCFALLPLGKPAAQFVEITAEIQTHAYRLNDTNSSSAAKPRTVHVRCVVGANQWYIEEDSSERNEWLFDGHTVVCRSRPPLGSDAPSNIRKEAWESRDGHPLGAFGVNIPWLAFCSGTYLKRDGRLIPLPAAVLRHCPDRFAYVDNTTTFPDEWGLPRSLDLFSSQALFLKSHTDWDKEHSFGDRYTEWNQKTAPKIQDGVLVFHYAVLESTNMLGRSFPTMFELFQTGRQYEENGNWFCQATGHVKSISPSTSLPSLK
jgi:hypothetical protein